MNSRCSCCEGSADPGSRAQQRRFGAGLSLSGERLASVHTWPSPHPAPTSSALRLTQVQNGPEFPPQTYSLYSTWYKRESGSSNLYLPPLNTESVLFRMRTLAVCARRASALSPPRAAQRQWRAFSVSPFMGTAQSSSMRPLDGIRVLDMTRVLAGVCSPHP